MDHKQTSGDRPTWLTRNEARARFDLPPIKTSKEGD